MTTIQAGDEATPMTDTAGTSAPCLGCGQSKEAHRKPGTTELRCPAEPAPKDVKDGGRLEAVWSEARTVRASCVAHRREVRWEPAPMWWHHTDLRSCPFLLAAPSPIPRDKPFRSGRYGQQRSGSQEG